MWKLLVISVAVALAPPPVAFRDRDSLPVGQKDKAIFAGGCFWGLESYFRKAPGVTATTVGYTGGTVEHPTYEQVCTKRTGHLEAIEIVFDSTETSYEALTKLFFEIREPVRADEPGGGADKLFHSAVFYLGDEQKVIAEGLIGGVAKKGYRVVTRVVEAGAFWPAEEYHQDYYEKLGKAPHCHTLPPQS